MNRRDWAQVIRLSLWMGLLGVGLNSVSKAWCAEEKPPVQYRVEYRYYTLSASTLNQLKDWEWNIIRNLAPNLELTEKVEPLAANTLSTSADVIQANGQNRQFDSIFYRIAKANEVEQLRRIMNSSPNTVCLSKISTIPSQQWHEDKCGREVEFSASVQLQSPAQHAKPVN